MKRISILLIIILVFNVSLVIVNGDTINTNEYDAYKIYDSSTKVIIDDNQVVPDGANILLFDKDKKKIISIDKFVLVAKVKYMKLIKTFIVAIEIVTLQCLRKIGFSKIKR